MFFTAKKYITTQSSDDHEKIPNKSQEDTRRKGSE